jgi:hypothetical protein
MRGRFERKSGEPVVFLKAVRSKDYHRSRKTGADKKAAEKCCRSNNGNR